MTSKSESENIIDDINDYTDELVSGLIPSMNKLDDYVDKIVRVLDAISKLEDSLEKILDQLEYYIDRCKSLNVPQYIPQIEELILTVNSQYDIVQNDKLLYEYPLNYIKAGVSGMICNTTLEAMGHTLDEEELTKEFMIEEKNE